MPPRPATAKKTGPLSAGAPIRAILGSDEAEVKRVAAQAAAAMTPEGGGEFALEIIDGAADHADGAARQIHATIEAVETLPFFGGEKLVWLKSANFFGDTVTGRAAAVVEAVERLTDLLANRFPPGVRFLLSATEIDKRRSFYKTLGKIAEVEIYDELDATRSGWEEKAAVLARRFAEERGLQLAGDELELFALLAGGNTRQIRNEIEKLDLFLGEARRRVTMEDLRLMVPSSRAGVIFELGNALAARDLNRAIGLIEPLLFQGESAIGLLLVAIIPTVRNLLLAKDLLVRHRLKPPAAAFHFGRMLERLPASATVHLPRKKDGSLNTYSLGIAATGAHRYELDELQDALEACLEANVNLVSSGLDARTLLTELVVRIAAPKTRPAGAAPRRPSRK